MPKNDNRQFYSRFGGLWTDRSDAAALLARKIRDGIFDEHLAHALEHFISHGYVVFERAVDPALCDEYAAFVEATFRDPPPGTLAHWNRQVVPLSMAIHDDVAKVSDLHVHFARPAEIIYPAPVLRFLRAIYERPPVMFQTMTMRKGSEEPLHTDTGPLTLTEPCSLAASWLALEDVDPRAGALEYLPGSHHIEVLVNGVSKAHHGDYVGYGKALAEIRRRCDSLGMVKERFMAKKGDVLIWAANLMHGGAPIEDKTRTRKSLVSHFMPYGAMPTFVDFSLLDYVRYDNGGYFLDRLHPRSAEAAEGVTESPAPPQPIVEEPVDVGVGFPPLDRVLRALQHPLLRRAQRVVKAVRSELRKSD